MTDDGSDTPTPDNPGKIRIPTTMEVHEAVESTPTVRDDEKPDLEIPSYLKPKTKTIELNIDATDGLPVVADPSNSPTEKMDALSQPVITEPRPTSPKSAPPWPLFIAVIVVVIGLIVFFVSR